jgi:hypothetical protein
MVAPMAVPPESTTSRPPLLTMVRLAKPPDWTSWLPPDTIVLIAVPSKNIAGLHPAQNLVDQVFTVYVVKNLMK